MTDSLRIGAESVTGACLCGELRYRVRLPARWVAHCHCSYCRRAHGAAFVTWVGLAREDFELLQADSLCWYASSTEARRGFCARCGATCLFESGHWPDETHVTLASLDSAAGLEPQAHAYWSSRASWTAAQDDGLPRVDPPDHA
jgi:hypothetical protein